MLNTITNTLPSLSAQLVNITPPTLRGILEDRIVPLYNTFAFTLAPIVLVVMLVFAGYYRMMGGSDPGQIKKSNAIIMWAIIGFAILFISTLLVQLIVQVVGGNVTPGVITF
jgi:hypothetical protein